MYLPNQSPVVPTTQLVDPIVCPMSNQSSVVTTTQLADSIVFPMLNTSNCQVAVASQSAQVPEPTDSKRKTVRFATTVMEQQFDKSSTYHTRSGRKVKAPVKYS